MRRRVGLLLAAALLTPLAPAAEVPAGEAGEEPALEFELTVIADLVEARSHGRRLGRAALGYGLAAGTVDTERAGLWRGGTAFASILLTSGPTPSEFVGDAQVSSNIEAGDIVRPYEIWYEHLFASGRGRLLVGVHDFNADFDVVETGSLLLNSSFGIEPATSQVGPSIFPATGLAVRGAYEMRHGAYLLGGVYDGHPGTDDDPTRLDLSVGADDGCFHALEVGWTTGAESAAPLAKVGVGLWYHTVEFEDPSGRAHRSNRGAYLLAERDLLRRAPLGPRLRGFVQLGDAQDDRNPVAGYAGAGLRLDRFWSRRPADALGLAFGQARGSRAWARRDGTAAGSERVFELTYRAELFPALAVQPDIQYVTGRGLTPGGPGAWVFSLRVELGL